MISRTYGAQSMVGKLKRALVHRPGIEFSDEGNYRSFGFTGPVPDLSQAQDEHDAFTQCLKEFGVQVDYVENVETKFTGSTYVTDCGIVTDNGIVVSRMGKPQRIGEEKAVVKKLTEIDVPIYYTIQAPGTVEGGGETIWLDHDTLLVGRTFRTNNEAYRQLKHLLSNVDVIQFQLPYYQGPGTVLHLGSVMSMIDEHLCVGYLPLMPIEMYELLHERDIEIIPIDDDEFGNSASNILAVEPDKVVMVAGNPNTQSALEQRGVEVKTFGAHWTGRDRHAGPTCMTMSVLREY
ncbi:MAG: arginine deiminase family protein [Bifidobacterium tibiigranuli]|jgi:N-dimethylarginine dimethylaminohydrolase|uniref:dimethylarginine dimethylaminohydrolase family protein n=1 Tax=Bifidobacterium tibiigranuli TaxID=2172043 RepID=UPI0026EC25DD|nr:arginine deiminase family protein [Bifidobacterium tibiigranuli]MCI1673618.1 arginine deiminase family protein [Bifidobacterium tibiigranuli]MCI1713787.1 arginine deiminase family protein [Bifidobacterium tibiigranuli]